MAAALRHARAILLLPGMVLGVIPAAILVYGSYDGPDWSGAPRVAGLVAGALALLLGISLMTLTIRLFARVGEGTLAPWDPTRKLVVEGVYRHVRNPMISGVCSNLLGEALLFASRDLLAWAAFFFALNALFIPLLEEPDLRRRFGADYDEYRRHVPRWIPRRSPWRGPGSR